MEGKSEVVVQEMVDDACRQSNAYDFIHDFD
jgi:hypothetical protein